MAHSTTSKVLELFGLSTRENHDWSSIVSDQHCPLAGKTCFKVRKSDPSVSIGTCSLRYGKKERDVIVCPNRLLERRQVFMDCIHLLSQHEPGNELHVVPEVSIPGGSVDYFLVSVRNGRVRDFVAIEFQTLDTTGTIWPERQRLLAELGFETLSDDTGSSKSFGMNWKMTAKTILVQMHHKVETLQHIGKHLVLVIQNYLLEYLRREFKFDHIVGQRDGDTLQIHAYRLDENGGTFTLALAERISTDAEGVAECLGVQAETRVELETIVANLEQKISSNTLLTMDLPMPSAEIMPAQ